MPRGSLSGIRHAARFRWAPWQERFEARVDRTPGFGPQGDCHKWTGTIVGYPGNQYGVIQVDGQVRRAHRLAWELAHGRPFPEGLLALHSCDVGICVNPAHIRPGTQRDNMQDAVARDRLRPYGGRPPLDRARGSRIGSAKLVEADVIAIRNSALTRKALAARYGVSQVTIDRIINRQTWKHV